MEYSEEEKKAIEDLNKLYFLLDDVYSTGLLESEERDEYQKSIYKALGIIEKQQNEIENQKNIIKEKAIVINNQELDKAKIHNNWQKELKENYIPKEAIREKIDDLQRYKGLVMYEKYNYDAIIRHLKELLGE